MIGTTTHSAAHVANISSTISGRFSLATAMRVPGPLVLLGAVSWELGQGLQTLPGVFTWPDFSVSMAAGIAAVLCGAEAAPSAKGAGE